MKIAYIMSRFPNLTETFVLYEIVALDRRGVATAVYPLLRMRQRVIHPDVESLAGRVHHHPFLSAAILRSNWHWLRRRPGAYCRVLREVLGGTWGSLNFFVGALGIFPKAVHFAREMEAEGVTHVHAHFSNHPAVAALIVHRLTGIPFSFTAHGHDIHVERRMLAEKIAAAEFAVMISEYNKRLVVEECDGVDGGKLHVIHCGADTERFAPRDSRAPGGRFALVCVGSFIEVKGHAYLIEACRVLEERGVRIHCHLIGDGPGRKELARQIAESGLDEAVVMHGALPRPAVAELIAACDVIVQPSAPTARGAREGIPVSLMEGMASGLPVVASRLSGIPELVEDGRTGILVPPRDAGALAGALERLFEDPALRRQLGRAGRQKVLDDFDLDRNAGRLVALVEEAAARRDARRPAGSAQESVR
jgi:glycosyltransferase involved in cell wall biosynthesis